MSLTAVFAQSEQDSTSANPFAVIEYIELRISGNKTVNVDSIKYELVKQYVMDCTALGQPVAYDSLSQRAMRHMYSLYSETTPSNYGSLDDIENENEASEGELFRLRRENEELKKRVSTLEFSSRRNGVPVVSKEEQARTNAWVQKVLKQTKMSADSMTLKSLKGKDKIHLPLCFSSVSNDVFKPHFVDTAVVHVGVKDTMPMTRMLAQRKIGRSLENRLLYIISSQDPSVISYYGLGEYQKPDFSLKDRRVRLIDVKQNNPEDYELETPSMRKQKRIDDVWKTNGKVNVSFVTYFISHWSGGGKNTTTFMSDFRLDRNYKKDPRRWNNRLDMYLGFIYYEKDKTHPFRINEDCLAIFVGDGIQCRGKRHVATKNLVAHEAPLPWLCTAVKALTSQSRAQVEGSGSAAEGNGVLTANLLGGKAFHFVDVGANGTHPVGCVGLLHILDFLAVHSGATEPNFVFKPANHIALIF